MLTCFSEPVTVMSDVEGASAVLRLKHLNCASPSVNICTVVFQVESYKLKPFFFFFAGRLFDFHVLDMIELGIEKYTSLTDIKVMFPF